MVFSIGIISLAAANLLVLMRVVTLWDHNKVRLHAERCITELITFLRQTLKILLFVILALSFAVNIVFVVLVISGYHCE